MKVKATRWWFVTFLSTASLLNVAAQSAEKGFEGAGRTHRSERRAAGVPSMPAWAGVVQFSDSCWRISYWLHGRRCDHFEPPRGK